jgi:hypothetical protein
VARYCGGCRSIASSTVRRSAPGRLRRLIVSFTPQTTMPEAVIYLGRLIQINDGPMRPMYVRYSDHLGILSAFPLARYQGLPNAMSSAGARGTEEMQMTAERECAANWVGYHAFMTSWSMPLPPTSIPIEEWTGSAGDAHSNYKQLSSG